MTIYRTMKFRLLIVMNLMLCLFHNVGVAQNIGDHPVRIYELWDWVTYKYGNHPTSLSEGIEYLYFGTSGGVYAFHKYGRYWTEPYTVSNGLSDDYISAVLFDHTTNYLWAAHRKGISYLTPVAQRWENVSKAQLHLPESNQILRLGTDGNAIWVQAEGGYLFTISKIMGFHLEMKSAVPTTVEWQPTIQNAVPDIRNYSIDHGLQIDGRGVVLDSELREYKVTLFDAELSNDVFGGIDGLGLFEGEANIRNIRLRPLGPLQNFINALAVGDNQLWMSGNQPELSEIYPKAGISLLNLKDNSWSYFENLLINQLATDEINDLAFANRQLWIGTNQGLTIFDQKKDRWKRLSMSNGLPDEVITTIGLEDTVAWIGTPRGLCTVRTADYKARRQKLAPRQNILKIYKITIDGQYIWVGTDNGLYSIDKFNHNVEHYDMFGSRIGLDDAVAAQFTAIGRDDSTTVFGRYNGLLQYSHTRDRWIDIPLTGALNDVDIFDIAISGNYMWLGTNRGAFLMRLDDYYCENYTVIDGLAGNNVFKIIIDGDLVWFATEHGLTKYNWSKYAAFSD